MIRFFSKGILGLAAASTLIAASGCNSQTVCRKIGEGRINLAVLSGQVSTSLSSMDFFQEFCTAEDAKTQFLGKAAKDLSRLMDKKLSYTTVTCLEYGRQRVCDDMGTGFPPYRPICRWETVCVRDRKDFHKRDGYDEASTLRSLAMGAKSGLGETCALLTAGLTPEATAKLQSVSEAIKAASVEESFDKVEASLNCER